MLLTLELVRITHARFSHEVALFYLGIVGGSTLFLWLVYACWPSFRAEAVRPEGLVTSPYSPVPDEDPVRSEVNNFEK